MLPAVASLEEGQHEDRGLRLQDNRITELYGKLVVDMTDVDAPVIHRRQGVVGITAEGYDLRAVGVVSRHSVTADLIAFERRVTKVAVVVSEISELSPCHEHQVSYQAHEERALECPLVVFDPAVAVLIRHVDVIGVLVPEEGVGRRKLEGNQEVRALTGIDGLVGRISGQGYLVAYVIGLTGVEQEVVAPVVQVVGLPAQLVIEDEVVVRPLEAASQGCRDSVHLIVLVRVLIKIIRVGLPGIVSGQVEGRGLLSEQPGFQEVDRSRSVIGTVCLESQREGLGIAQGNRLPCPLLEETLDGEVVEADSDGTHERVASPSSRKLKLGVRLLRHVVGYVDRVVYLIGYHGIAAGMVQSLLGVEVTHRGYLPERTLQHGLAVQVTGLGEYLTAHDLLMGDGIAADDDLVESGGLALDHTQLHVDGIPHDVGLHGHYVEEDIALVRVEGVDIHELLLGVSEEAFLHVDHVIDIALLDHQDSIELIGRIEGVAGPRDVAEVVPPALVYHELYTQPVLLYIIYGVLDDARVAETGLVEGADQRLLVVLIFLLVEFLVLEDIPDAHVTGLGH